MGSEISRQSSLASSATRQATSLASPSKSDQARERLIRMATQVTSGTGVKSGYLQLSAGNQQLSTRWLGANAGTQRAVTEVRRLVSEAYGDVPGAQEALDRYLAASGDRIGTRSFVKLVKALESASGQEPTQALQAVEEGVARLETDHLSAGMQLLELQRQADGLIGEMKGDAEPGSSTALQAWFALSALNGQVDLLQDELNADQSLQAERLAQQVGEQLNDTEPALVSQFADAHTHLEEARRAMASSRPKVWAAHQQALDTGVKDTIALMSSPQQSPPLTDQAMLMCTRALLRYYTAGGQAERQACEGFAKSMEFDRLLAQAQMKAEQGDETATQLRDALNALTDTLDVHASTLPAAEVTKTLATVPQALQQEHFEAFDRFAEQALAAGPEGKVAAWREVQATGIKIFKATGSKSQDDQVEMASAMLFAAAQKLSPAKAAAVLLALQDQQTLRTLMVPSTLSRAAAKHFDAERIRMSLGFRGDHLLGDLASNIELSEVTGLARMVDGLRSRVRGLAGPISELQPPDALMVLPELRSIDAATAEAVRRDIPEMAMHELVMRAQITDSEPFAKLDSARQASYLHAREVLDAIDDIDLKLSDRQEALLARVMDHPSAKRQTDPKVRDAFIQAVTDKASDLLEAMESQGRMLEPEELFGILTSVQPNAQESEQMIGNLAGVIAARLLLNTD
jgi:hypothetical protein